MTTSSIPSSSEYTVGYSEDHIRFVSGYQPQQYLGYLKPWLEPGKRILDMGSGAGFVSVEVAKLIAPGELHGVDIEQSQVDLATYHASQQGVGNTTFHLASVCDVPFEDGYFDIVHCNDILAYIPDIQVALQEIKRVVKPGGMVGCRELMLDSCFAHPDLGIISRARDIFSDLLRADDGNPEMGKDLNRCLQEAGFVDIEISASYVAHSGLEGIENVYALFKNWFLSSQITEPAKQYGAATNELFAEIAAGIEEWRKYPWAWAGIGYGQAVAVSP